MAAKPPATAAARPLVQDILLALWRLLPGNPIVLRVVQGGSKRRQHLWVRLSYLAVLFVVILVMQFPQLGANESLGTLAKTSTNAFRLIAMLQLAMICFLAPVFTAGAISQEKDAETFNVLLTTPLSNAQIVLGSLMSRLFFVLALLVAGLPIFCITMLFGGVTSQQIFLSFGIAGTTACLTGSLAILVSVMRVGTRGTIFSFYVGIALFLAAGLAIGGMSWTIVPESVVPGISSGMTWVTLVHPFFALQVALGSIQPPDVGVVAHYVWPLNHMLASPALTYMWLTLLASCVMAFLATFFVRRGIKQGELNAWTRLQQSLRKRFQKAQTHRVRRVWANPVAWREAVTRANAASSSLVRYSYLGIGLAGAAAFVWAYASGVLKAHGIDAISLLAMIVLGEFALVLLIAVNTAATAITREREDGTMEILLTTPLTSRYIVWGKLRGLVSFAVPLMAIPALTVLLVAVVDLVRAEPKPLVSLYSALLLPVLLAFYAAFACIIGLFMSLKSRKSVQAVLASIGLLVAVAFGLGLCALGAVNTTPQVGALTTPLTFVTAILFVLDPSYLSEGVGVGRMSAAETHALLTVGTVVAAGLYGAIVAGTYRAMITNFDMIIRKQSR